MLVPAAKYIRPSDRHTRQPKPFNPACTPVFLLSERINSGQHGRVAGIRRQRQPRNSARRRLLCAV